MPYLEDGRPVDIVLNPLGVPSRMNIGQILETHLGWAAHGRRRAAAEVHRGEVQRRAAQEAAEDASTTTRPSASSSTSLPDEEVVDALPAAAARASTWPRRCSTAPARTRSTRCSTRPRCRARGQMVLFDGRTGEPFDQNVTVGVMYMLKLHHLVDEKIHARSHRALLARHPAAAGRQGAVRRPASRRDGSLGDGGLRRGLHAAGVPHRQVRRRGGPHPHVRGHRQGRQRRSSPACPSRSTCSSRSSSRWRSTSSCWRAPRRAAATRRRLRRQPPRPEPRRATEHAGASQPAGAPRWSRASGERSNSVSICSSTRVGGHVKDIFNFFEKPKDPLSFTRHPHLAGVARTRSASGRTAR